MNNNKYIEANKEAWGKLSKDHYNRFKENLRDPEFKLNPIVEKELGDIN
jgi:hypothetical protein